MMTRLHAFALGAAVMLAAAVGFFLRHDRRDAAERAAVEQRMAARDSLIRAIQRRGTDTVYRRDTLRLRSTRDHYIALRDTIRQADPLVVNGLLDRALVAADAALAACSETVRTCERRVAERDSVIALLRAQRTDERRLASIGTPRLRTFAELAYEISLDSLAGAAVAIGAGAQLRLVWGISGDALAQFRPGTDHPLGAAVRLRKTFE